MFPSTISFETKFGTLTTDAPINAFDGDTIISGRFTNRLSLLICLFFFIFFKKFF